MCQTPRLGALAAASMALSAQPNRPQTPAKPYPYREEDLLYRNPRAGIQLAATLAIPEGPGPSARWR